LEALLHGWEQGVDAWQEGATVTTLFYLSFVASTEDTPGFNAMHLSTSIYFEAGGALLLIGNIMKHEGPV
jgi:hypothetical protein